MVLLPNRDKIIGYGYWVLDIIKYSTFYVSFVRCISITTWYSCTCWNMLIQRFVRASNITMFLNLWLQLATYLHMLYIISLLYLFAWFWSLFIYIFVGLTFCIEKISSFNSRLRYVVDDLKPFIFLNICYDQISPWKQ